MVLGLREVQAIEIGSLPISLVRYMPIHAREIFDLIDKSREHLSQNGDITAEKYQTLQDVLDSIVNPSNPDRLRMGIWDDATIVGGINFTPVDSLTSAEIGYWLGAQHTGKGYMVRAVEALTNYAFGVGFDEVFGVVAYENFPSQKVLQRARFENKSSSRDRQNDVFRFVRTKD